jgi:HPt (histidine-containing phosphotransfer) domain-containing protein
MNSLRFLLVHSDPRQSDQIASLLAGAHHTVLQTAQLDEARDALFVERFDAVLLGALVSPASLPEFQHIPILSLEDPLDPAALTEAVTRLAQAVGRVASDTVGMPILEPEKFEEQVCYDHDLMIEIIDLFLEERQHQVIEMRDSLATGDYALLSRMAHTIKGSLGSLHAIRATCRAQELELAAKAQDSDSCRSSFAALEHDLADLEPELLALRALPLPH